MISSASMAARRLHSAASWPASLRFAVYSSQLISFASLLFISAAVLSRSSLLHALLSVCDRRISSKLHVEISSNQSGISFQIVRKVEEDYRQAPSCTNRPVGIGELSKPDAFLSPRY